MALMGTGICVSAMEGSSDHRQKREWSSVMGGLPEAAELVIRDAEDWKSLWVRLSHEEPPVVDFTKMMAVGVFLGVKHTGGFTVSITSVVKRKDAVEVRYKQTSAPKGGYVIQAFTSPYHIKLIERTESPVVFKRVR